ncbi:MAG: ester cyclase [Acidimicrobiia bacterium]|jgi:ketosteroid isomerase-like protein
MAENGRAQVLRRALEACVTGDVDALPDLFTADVSGWSPIMLVSSLDELSETVAYREDALSDVGIDIDSLDLFGNKGLVEYRLNAMFTGPFVLHESTVIEPTGAKILFGAALVAEFSGEKISAFRNYFDDAALLEQMVAG